MLVGDQVQAERANSRPVLRWCDDRRRKPSGRLVPAVAAPPPGAMLDRRESDLGQIEHLPCPMADDDRDVETPLPAATDRRKVIDDLVRRRDLRQIAAVVTG